MKKTKKRALYIIAALLGALFVLACLAGFAACGGSEDACADGHTWDAGEVTTAATCTETGVKTYTCTVCGDTKTETIAALGHDYQPDASSTSNKDATCTTEGTQALKCSRCGATTTETIPATGNHTLVKTEAKAATCTEAGNNAYWTCSVCNKVFSDESGTTETTVAGQTIAALGHDLTITTTDATCTAGGTKTETCSRCEYTNTTTTSDPLGHALVGTYDSSSQTWTYTCDVCDAPIDLATNTDKIASLTLEATDEDSLLAAIDSNSEYTDVEPLISMADNVYIIIDNASDTTYTAENPQEIKLNADIEVGSNGYLQFRGNWKLDLNGHSISKVGEDTTGNYATIYVGSGSSAVDESVRYGNLTVCDSSTEGAGTIKGVTAVTVQGVQNTSGYTSKFTLESGTLVGSGFALGTNGTNSLGAEEIIVSGGTVSGGGTGIYLPNGSLTVTGGEISGRTGIEIKAGSTTISGGKISTTVSDGTTSVTENSNGASSSGYSVAIVYNSSYNSITSVTIGGCILTGSVYCDQSVESVVTISGVNIVVSTFDQFSWAMTLDDATVILGSDIETASLNTIYVHGTITLDLNGYTLKQTANASNGWGLICVEDGGNLTIEDSSSEGTGKIEVAAYYAITVKGAPSASKTHLTVESGTIECWGYVISTNGSGAASDGVGSYGNVEIVLKGGTYVSTDNEAIYIPVGTFKITNSTIIGTTGIEIRGGSLDISNSTVVGTGDEEVDWEGNINNGAISSGYAIANTHTSSYYTVTIKIGENVNICGLIYMKNDEMSSHVSARQNGTDDDKFTADGSVAFTGDNVTLTLGEDGFTYTIGGTSAAMNSEQAGALFDASHEGCEYVTFLISAGSGEIVYISFYNGATLDKSRVLYGEGVEGQSTTDGAFVLDTTNHTEGDWWASVVVTDEDGYLVASYVIVLGEITSSTAQGGSD